MCRLDLRYPTLLSYSMFGIVRRDWTDEIDIRTGRARSPPLRLVFGKDHAKIFTLFAPTRKSQKGKRVLIASAAAHHCIGGIF